MIRPLHSLAAAAAIALSISGFTAITTAPAAAQAAPGAGHGQRYGQMLMSLGLSDAQKASIRGIIANARKQNQTVTDPQVKRANMKAAFDQVRTVLTPAQRAKLASEVQAAKAQANAPDHS
jgi:Spy/CpxP family protein refolding chaperone